LGEIDTILRYSAFGLLLWLAVLCYRRYHHLIAGRVGVWAALSTAAYLHASKAGMMLAGVNLAPLLLPLSSLTLVFVWLFCLSQFDDHFEITWVHRTIGTVKLLTGVGAYYSYSWQSGSSPLYNPLYMVTVMIGLGVMLHLVYVVWRGRNDDLVEDRCRFRTLVSSSITLVGGTIIVGAPLAIWLGIEHYLLPVQAFAILGVTLFLHWQMAGDSGTDLFAFAPAGGVPPQALPRGPEPITPEDMHDLRALEGVMAEKIWLEPGLTIARLAECAGLPEHRLRRLINQHLGYRNFSDYLNHHRIGAAKERLGSVEERHLPILTIAMELGYQSLGPFNRAFKERTGVTPTEFRRQALADF